MLSHDHTNDITEMKARCKNISYGHLRRSRKQTIRVRSSDYISLDRVHAQVVHGSSALISSGTPFRLGILLLRSRGRILMFPLRGDTRLYRGLGDRF